MAAPKGNRNALKHGIYSRFLAVRDEKDMLGMKLDDNEDELAYARARLAAAQKEVKEAKNDEARLKWDYACRHWMEIILQAINQNLNRPQTRITIHTTLLEAVRAANDRQGVK